MENNNGKGIFYGVIGVATLIVAIIGATFAYFTATTTSSQYVTGTAATAGLNVSVIRMTGWSAAEGEGVTETTAKYVMVPQLDTALSAAIQGVRTRELVADGDGNEPGAEGYTETYGPWNYGPACIDAGGSLVCSIYKIVVQNTGSAPITVSGDIEFIGTSTVTEDGITNTEPGENGPTKGDNLMNHLKWARLEQPEGVVDGAYTYTAATNVTELDPTKNVYATLPTRLLDYTANNNPGTDEPYQTTTDGTQFYYANTATTINQYLYGMEVTVPADGKAEDYVDLLGGVTVTGAHKEHYDLIDPTNDLTTNYTAYDKVDASSNPYADGKWYLAAKDNAGDTKIFYIVVWISENNKAQNDYDQGQFTGMVTFNSSEGSGATSTFTQPYAD